MFTRDVVQLVRTPALGAGGRTFESYHPDQNIYSSSRIFWTNELFILKEELWRQNIKNL